MLMSDSLVDANILLENGELDFGRCDSRHSVFMLDEEV